MDERLPSEPPAGRTAVPVIAVLGALLSTQFGAAFATTLFDRVGPLGTVTVRLALAAAILCAVTRPPVRQWSRPEWRGVLALGMSLGVMNAAFYAALARLPLATAVTIEFLGPLTLAAVLSRRPRDLLWVALALGGIALLGSDGSGALGGLDPVGVVFALIAAAGWAGYIVAGSHVATTLSGSAGLAGATALAAVVVIPFGVATAGPQLLSPVVLTAGLAVALLSSAIPYSLEIRALRHMPKSVFSILIALGPVAAALAGAVVLGQMLTLAQLLGIALVVAAGVGALRHSRT